MSYDEAVRLAQKMAEEKGGIVVQDTAWEDYEDIPRWIMQGYTTMGYADAFIRCPEYMAAEGMHILASPAKGDTAAVAGESGAAALGAMANILLDEALAEYKKMLKLDENSRILCISTEGDTDRENYQNVVWDGKYSKFDE